MITPHRMINNVIAIAMVVVIMLLSSVYDANALHEKPADEQNYISDSTSALENTDELIAKRMANRLKLHEDEPVLKYIGRFKTTAYCACSKCCGKYAKSRPVDASGRRIIYTASGNIARPNHTIAADSSIPFGTVLNINGVDYTVEDRGSAVKGNVIDIYFDNHQEALNYGCHYYDVYVKE